MCPVLTKFDLLKLADKVADGLATDEELSLFNAYFDALQKEGLESRLSDTQTERQELEVATELKTRILKQISAEEGKATLRKQVSTKDRGTTLRKQVSTKDRGTKLAKQTFYFTTSATFLIATLSFLYIYRKSLTSSKSLPALSNTNKPHGSAKDLSPTSEIKQSNSQVLLTLANGKKIDLNNVRQGSLGRQGGMEIKKTAQGKLSYVLVSAMSQHMPADHLAYNTIATSEGGQCQLHLPDGSDVWLNSASSLKYPVQFMSGERRVELKGEAYFEVAKDKSRPFKVCTKQQEIRVLGTHFDINAYTDEDVTHTTLLRGSVNIRSLSGTSKGMSKLLCPGQQCRLNSRTFIIEKTDTTDAVSWKDGYFSFNDENIRTAMRTLARWYKIEVSFHGNLSALNVSGKISQSKSLNEVLRILELTEKIKFKIEGRKVTIMT